MKDHTSLKDNARFWICGLAFVFFCAACMLPAVTWNHQNTSSGLELLEMGILGVLFAPPAGWAWLANPLMICSFILLLRRSYRVAFILAVTSLMTGFVFTLSSVYFPLPADEAGIVTLSFNRGLIGFWLWLDVPILIATYCWLYLRNFKDRKNRGQSAL